MVRCCHASHPNTISLLIVLAGALSRVLVGPLALALSAATAMSIFLLLMIAFSRGLLGGGDVKIMTALAVGLSPFDSWRFVLVTAIAGGFLAVTYILLSHKKYRMRGAKRASLLGRSPVESWRIRRRGPLPYGVPSPLGEPSSCSILEASEPCRSVSSFRPLLLNALGLGSLATRSQGRRRRCLSQPLQRRPRR